MLELQVFATILSVNFIGYKHFQVSEMVQLLKVLVPKSEDLSLLFRIHKVEVLTPTVVLTSELVSIYI